MPRAASLTLAGRGKKEADRAVGTVRLPRLRRGRVHSYRFARSYAGGADGRQTLVGMKKYAAKSIATMKVTTGMSNLGISVFLTAAAMAPTTYSMSEMTT